MTSIELILLALTLIATLSIVTATLYLGISPMPSSKRARQGILELTQNTGTGTIYELGCGWGNVLIPLAKAHPQRHVIGYEYSLLPWFSSWVLVKLLKLKNVEVRWGNFLHADLSLASTLVCYLHPPIMQHLSDKLCSGSTKPDYLISNYFSLPAHRPDRKLELSDFHRTPIYRYALNRAVFLAAA